MYGSKFLESLNVWKMKSIIHFQKAHHLIINLYDYSISVHYYVVCHTYFNTLIHPLSALCKCLFFLHVGKLDRIRVQEKSHRLWNVILIDSIQLESRSYQTSYKMSSSLFLTLVNTEHTYLYSCQRHLFTFMYLKFFLHSTGMTELSQHEFHERSAQILILTHYFISNVEIFALECLSQCVIYLSALLGWNLMI